MKFTPIAKLLASILLAPGMLLIQSHAKVVAVYSKAGDTCEIGELKAIGLFLRDAEASKGVVDGFRYIVSETATLTPEFSVAPGEAAYFWSNRTYQLGDGFEMQGEGMLFEGDGEPLLAKEGFEEAASERIYTAALMEVSLHSQMLRVSYTASKPGATSVEIFDINGKTIGRWHWRSPAPGVHEKSFNVGDLLGGSYFLLWTTESISTVRQTYPLNIRNQQGRIFNMKNTSR